MEHAFHAFSVWSPAIIEMANVCAVQEGENRRADANETAYVAQALTAAGIAAVHRIYAGITFRQLAPLQEGIGPGADTYTWQEYDLAGMAKIVANYAKDLPNVAEFVNTNTGIIRTIADAFEYTKQDLRRVIEARRQGRQAEILDVDKISRARQMIERKKDVVAYLGDTTYNLPGILKNANVTVVTASTPGSGSSKLWTGVDKTGAEILKDLRTLVSTIEVQSQGNFTLDGPTGTVVIPIEEYAAIRTKPLVGSTENQITVWKQFALEYPTIEVIRTVRAKLANAANNGPRIMAYQRDPEVLRMVEPLDFEADAPQRDGLTFKVPCDSRFGGIFIKQPLAAVYMDF
jgi:hypothetical protein